MDASAESGGATPRSTAHVVRPLPDNLVTDGAVGAGAGVVLVNLVPFVWPQPPPWVSGSILWSLVVVGVEMLVIGAATTLLLRRFNTLRFEPEQLVITRLLWPRQRIGWSQVVSARMLDVNGGHHHSAVAYRQLVLDLRLVQDARTGRLRPGFSDRMRWRGRIYRDVTLPIRFPRSVSDESVDAPDPNSRAQKAIRHELATRQIALLGRTA